MSHVKRILGPLVKDSLFKRFLSDIALFIGLAIIIGVIVGAIILSGLYATYLGLVYYGLASNVAAITVGIVSLLIIAVLVMIIRNVASDLQTMPEQLIKLEGYDFSYYISDLVEAFVEGFMSEPQKQEYSETGNIHQFPQGR